MSKTVKSGIQITSAGYHEDIDAAKDIDFNQAPPHCMALLAKKTAGLYHVCSRPIKVGFETDDNHTYFVCNQHWKLINEYLQGSKPEPVSVYNPSEDGEEEDARPLRKSLRQRGIASELETSELNRAIEGMGLDSQDVTKTGRRKRKTPQQRAIERLNEEIEAFDIGVLQEDPITAIRLPRLLNEEDYAKLSQPKLLKKLTPRRTPKVQPYPAKTRKPKLSREEQRARVAEAYTQQQRRAAARAAGERSLIDFSALTEALGNPEEIVYDEEEEEEYMSQHIDEKQKQSAIQRFLDVLGL